VSGVPPLAGNGAAGGDPDECARFFYTLYRTHRNMVEGAKLPEWEHLCEAKRDRFRAIAAGAKQFPHYVTGAKDS
jgi:hypothetical protein